ncbi:hypothetical protein Tco_0397749 [Tanacetum coccineum]
MAGFTHNQLKNKSFDKVQKAFDKTMSWIDSVVLVDSEVVKGSKDRAEGSETRAEGSSKRAGKDIQQESTKKQKMGDDKEKEELKQCFKIVPDDGDDVTIDATPLSIKILIADYKIYQEGKKSFFQIIRADGKTQMYLTFSKMLKNFDREDLETLWRIVKARFKKIEPVNYMDIFLHINLKTMFEHHVEVTEIVHVLAWQLITAANHVCLHTELFFDKTYKWRKYDQKIVKVTPHSSSLKKNRSRADKEVKMASIVDDVNAYSYLIPLELLSKKLSFKWLASYLHTMNVQL